MICVCDGISKIGRKSFRQAGELNDKCHCGTTHIHRHKENRKRQKMRDTVNGGACPRPAVASSVSCERKEYHSKIFPLGEGRGTIKLL